jgi:hypothetical protein
LPAGSDAHTLEAAEPERDGGHVEDAPPVGAPADHGRALEDEPAV